MSETTDRTGYNAEITTAKAALPAALASVASAESALQISRTAFNAAALTYGTGSTQERAAFADYQAKIQLLRVAEAEVSSKNAVINDRTEKLIALPSGKEWQQAEAKASGMVQGLERLSGPLKDRMVTAKAALQTLRGLLFVSITPEQLIAQSASNLQTILTNIGKDKDYDWPDIR
jgi:hypothetical protein